MPTTSLINGRLSIELTVAAPFITQSTVAGSYGTDLAVARVGGATGAPMLAFSLLKGRLRDAWTELNQLAAAMNQPPIADVAKWLGAENGSSSWASAPGQLQLEDLLLTEFAEATAMRFRVAIDPARRAASDDMLFTVEQPWASGEVLTFRGQATVLGVTGEDELRQLTTAVRAGLKWMGAVGALRGVGFGRVRSVTIGYSLEPAMSLGTMVSSADAIPLRLTFDQPFCISEPQADGNLFQSNSQIPGSVLKGALAMMIRRCSGAASSEPVSDALVGLPADLRELARHFAQLRVLHAMPVKPDHQRPAALPLSLALLEGENMMVDMANVDSVDGLQSPLMFQTDWKDSHFSHPRASLFGSDTELRTILRVRTAIDPVTRRAWEQKLFGYRMIDPTGVEWTTEVQLHAIPAASREAVLRGLHMLLSNGSIPGIGKTKARATVIMGTGRVARDAAVASNRQPIDGRWVICVQTPTLLANPATYSSAGSFAAYRDVLADLSGGSVALVRAIADEQLRGGNYLYHTYQADPGRVYEPYLLTSAGSVFVVQPSAGATVQAAQLAIDEWILHGIPTPRWAREAFGRRGHDGAHWSNNPYIAANGFGEIRVNMPIHSMAAYGSEQAQETRE